MKLILLDTKERKAHIGPFKAFFWSRSMVSPNKMDFCFCYLGPDQDMGSKTGRGYGSRDNV